MWVLYRDSWSCSCCSVSDEGLKACCVDDPAFAGEAIIGAVGAVMGAIGAGLGKPVGGEKAGRCKVVGVMGLLGRRVWPGWLGPDDKGGR